MEALSRQSRPQKLVRSGGKEIIHRPHLAVTGIGDSRGDAEHHASDV